jgi:hypothetical protein
LLMVERCLERGKELTSKAGSIKWSSPSSASEESAAVKSECGCRRGGKGVEKRVQEGRPGGEKESAVVPGRHALAH